MISKARSPSRGPSRVASGFTLLEVIVVVLLVAITTTFAMAKLGPDDRDTVLGEAGRLALGLQHAQDEAVMTGSGLAWRGDAGGYQYFRRGPDRNWVPLENAEGFAPHQLPLPVRLVDVEVGGLKVALGTLVVFSPSALGSPVRIVLEANSERAAVEVGASARVVPGHGV